MPGIGWRRDLSPSDARNSNVIPPLGRRGGKHHARTCDPQTQCGPDLRWGDIFGTTAVPGACVLPRRFTCQASIGLPGDAHGARLQKLTRLAKGARFPMRTSSYNDRRSSELAQSMYAHARINICIHAPWHVLGPGAELSSPSNSGLRVPYYQRSNFGSRCATH